MPARSVLTTDECERRLRRDTFGRRVVMARGPGRVVADPPAGAARRAQVRS